MQSASRGGNSVWELDWEFGQETAWSKSDDITLEEGEASENKSGQTDWKVGIDTQDVQWPNRASQLKSV